MADTCVFCDIASGTGPATVLREWDDAIAFLPKDPVLDDGHLLVIPKVHVKDQLTDPAVTGMVAMRTAELVRDLGPEWSQGNFAFNTGEWGGQTVFHLHGHQVRADVHIRHTMPWFGQQLRDGRAFYVGVDGDGEQTLWTGDRHHPMPVATKHQLDDMDPILWPALTGVLAPTHLDGEQT
jgi:histidine triad (HIT) family protein